jgi:sugar phosphate isomerase/epimerase
MTDWPCGLSTGCFYRTPILDALPAIRDGGFQLLEICSFPAHLDCHDARQVEAAAEALRAHGMQAASLHAPYAPHIDIAHPDPAQRDASVRELLVAAESAQRLGCRFLVLHPGPEQEGRPRPEQWYDRMHHAAESLNRIATRCRELGLVLLLENMLPHLMFGHTGDMLFLLGAIRETNVGTCLDTGHAWLSRDLPTVVHKLSGHLRMLHANDNRGHRDDHLPPGQGSIDWKSLVCQLIRWRFRGTIILELAGHGSPEEILAGARQAREYLGELCRQAETECPPE